VAVDWLLSERTPARRFTADDFAAEHVQSLLKHGPWIDYRLFYQQNAWSDLLHEVGHDVIELCVLYRVA
jgi:hypothetical protein